LCGAQQWETSQLFSHQEQNQVIARIISLLSCTRHGRISFSSRIALALSVPLLLYGWVRAAFLLPRSTWLVHPFPLGCPTIQVLAFSVDEDSRLGKNVAKNIRSGWIDMMRWGKLRQMVGFGERRRGQR
jgi:hypothetical protein